MNLTFVIKPDNYFISVDSNLYLEEAYNSVNVNSHQGVCVDLNFIYTIDTDKIFKRYIDNGYTIYAIKTLDDILLEMDYLGINIFENVPNHLGDGCQIGDYIYVPLEYWGGCGDFVHYGEKSSDHFILKINKKDLSLEQAYKIEITEISGIGTDGKILYIVSYCDGSKIWIYDFDGNYIDFIPLSQPINNIQGIAVDSRKNEFYVSCDLDKSIYKFDLYGNLISKVLEATENITLEGLDIIKNKIYILIESYPINSLPMQIIHIFKIKE